MILSELRNYIRIQKRVALTDTAAHFNIEVDALRGMLNKWITKGQIRKLPPGTSCSGGCCKCDANLIELYEWVES